MTGNRLRRLATASAVCLVLAAVLPRVPLAQNVLSEERVVVLSVGTEPELSTVERPRYPRTPAVNSVESWVGLRFEVDEQGRPRDVHVYDSGGEGGVYQGFERAAIQALKRWRFTPATLDGKRVSRTMRQVVQFEIDPGRGVSPEFRTLFKAASDALAGETPDLQGAAQALAALKELNTRVGRSMMEHGLAAVLSVDYHLARGEEAQALEYAERAVELLERSEMTAAYHRVLRQAFALHAGRHDYRTALDRFATLVEADMLLDPDDPIHAEAARIRELLDGDRPIVSDARLERCLLCRDDTYLYDRPLNRKRFTVEAEAGAVDRIRIRCGVDKTMIAWSAEQVWRVDSAAEDCDIAIYGEPGAAFTLVELAETAG